VRLNPYWRAFLVGLCVLAALGGLTILFAPDLAGLFLLALYAIPSNSVLPIPHEPGVLYFAKFYDPLWISLAATMASVIVSFADYGIIHAAMRVPRMSAAQNSRLFRWAVRWMKRWPFWIVVVFSLTPLPISIIRVLAPASGYPIQRYALAQVVGRLPRFYILAWLGSTIDFPSWVLAMMFVALLLTFWLSGRPADEIVSDGREADPDLIPAEPGT
jgi:membrane protein YqaA with SNARE-associated domain